MEDGSLKAIGQQADKAADKVDELGRSARTADRNLKGTAQMTSNTSKQFSKMQQGITGGLVPAYATLAANVFAISAAFNFFKRAADLKILEEGQRSYAATSGVALQSITSNLRDAAGGMLGFREAAEAAAIGVAKGFSPQQLNELAEGARRASAALGRNFEDAFDRLIRGASKAEPELLDELGITLRLADASARYAETIGKTAKELTTFEKSQAVLIETQRQLNEMYGDMDMVSNPFVTLAKTFDDIVKAGTNFILPLFEGIANIINNNAVAAIAVFGAIGVSIFKMAIPIDKVKKSLDDWGNQAAASADKASRRLKAYNRLLERTKKKLEAASGRGLQNTAKSMQARGVGTGSKLVGKAAAGQLTDPKQQGQLKAHLNKALVQFKKYGEVRTGILKGATKQELLDMKMGLKQQQIAHKRTFGTMTMTVKRFAMGAKFRFMQIKSAGVTAAAAIGRGFIRLGGVMNAALRGAGIIGLLIMIVEMGRELMKSPYDIMLSILKGVDKIVTAIVNGFGSLIDMIAEPMDNMLNKARGMFNTLIKGFNKARELVGKKPIKLLETDKTGMQDMAKDLKNFKSDLAGSFKGSGFAEFLLDVQTSQRSAADAKAAFNGLKDSIKTMGDDMTSITDGLLLAAENGGKLIDKFNKGEISAKDFGNAMDTLKSGMELDKVAAMATLGVSTLMRKIEKETDADKKADLQRRLKEATDTAATISLDFARTIKEGNADAVEDMEKLSQKAGESFTALKTAIMDIGQAMQSGNLTQIEATLDTLDSMKDKTDEYFTALFGDKSEAARIALKKFEESLKETGMTTSEYREALRKLREEHNKLAKSQAISEIVGGQLGKILKAANAVRAIALEIETIDIKLKTAAPAEKIALQDAKKLLQIKKALKESETAPGSQGALGLGLNQAVALAEQLEDKFKSGGVREIISGITTSMNQMADSFKQFGPEGEAIAKMIEGIAMLSGAFDNFAERMDNLTTELLPELAAGNSATFDQMWNAADGYANKAKIVGAVAGMLADQFGAMAQVMAAKYDKSIAAVDKLIEREKAMDGRSAASVEKLKALEAKKEQMKRKAFETDKKLKLAQAVMATAAGVANALSLAQLFPFNFVLAGLIGAMGAMQINMISGMQYEGGAKSPQAPSKVSMGERKNTVDLAKANNAGGEIAYARGESGTGTGMTDFTPAFSGYKHRAAGGYVVGEQGPEIFVPQVPGDIIPSGQAVGGTSNVNFSINAVDATGVQDLLIEQRGNIISMIREAANENGQFFLEEVDETVYGGA